MMKARMSMKKKKKTTMMMMATIKIKQDPYLACPGHVPGRRWRCPVARHGSLLFPPRKQRKTDDSHDFPFVFFFPSLSFQHLPIMCQDHIEGEHGWWRPS